MEVSKLHKLFVECNYLVSTDTRKIIPNSIFFALKGPNFDGNDYAIEAIKKGASYAVIDKDLESDLNAIPPGSASVIWEACFYIVVK